MFLPDAGKLPRDVAIQRFEAFGVAPGVLRELRRMLRISIRERRLDVAHVGSGEPRVHPEVGVGMSLVVPVRLHQRDEALRRRDHPGLRVRRDEAVQPALQPQAVAHDEIGIGNPARVRRHRLVGVRIAADVDDGDDLEPLSRHRPHEIGKDADRDDCEGRLLVVCGSGGQRKQCNGGDGKTQHCASVIGQTSGFPILEGMRQVTPRRRSRHSLDERDPLGEPAATEDQRACTSA